MSAPVFQDKVTVIAENFLNAISKTVYEGLGGKATPDEIVAWLGLTPGGGGTTTIIDDLLSHAVADALSANQGRILDGKITASEQTANKGVSSGYAPLDASAKVPVVNLPDAMDTSTFATHQEVIDGDALQQTLADKDQASGYVSLDANSKVPLQFLPVSSTSNHMFANVAEMLAGGQHIDLGDTALVHGDPDSTKDGHYVALKNHPVVIADWFKDDAVGIHRHSSDDVDVLSQGSGTHTLSVELSNIAMDLAHMLRADGKNPFVGISPAEVSALINESLYLDERNHLMWKNASGLHEVLNFADVAANTQAIATNAGKIATNTTGVATATSDATAAKSDAATALSAANTASSVLNTHINKVADAHPYTAITDVEKVFTDRLAGYTTSKTLKIMPPMSINDLLVNSEYAVVHGSTHSGVFPVGFGLNHWGILSVKRVGNSNQVTQVLISVSGDSVGKMWVRASSEGALGWSVWKQATPEFTHVQLTQAAYTALATKDPKTLYLIVG